MYIYSLINNAYVRTHAGLISYSSLCSPEGFLYIINVYKYMHIIHLIIFKSRLGTYFGGLWTLNVVFAFWVKVRVLKMHKT